MVDTKLDSELDAENKDQVLILREEEKEFLGEEKADKLLDLRMRLNESRKLNNKAVIEENERLNDPKFEKKRAKREWIEQNEDLKETMKLKGIPENKMYLNDTTNKCMFLAKKNKAKNKKTEAFGWEGNLHITDLLIIFNNELIEI